MLTPSQSLHKQKTLPFKIFGSRHSFLQSRYTVFKINWSGQWGVPIAALPILRARFKKIYERGFTIFIGRTLRTLLV